MIEMKNVEDIANHTVSNI